MTEKKAFKAAWSLLKGDGRECPTCGEVMPASDFGTEHIDDAHFDETGEEKWLKPKNPNQCRLCEWGD